MRCLYVVVKAQELTSCKIALYFHGEQEHMKCVCLLTSSCSSRMPLALQCSAILGSPWPSWKFANEPAGCCEISACMPEPAMLLLFASRKGVVESAVFRDWALKSAEASVSLSYPELHSSRSCKSLSKHEELSLVPPAPRCIAQDFQHFTDLVKGCESAAGSVHALVSPE